ncbi:MAG: acyltransferase [Candidatus Omnitrophica bacterium]|nr:acyltransferase [Candidatus Omnitrophota bacterium]
MRSSQPSSAEPYRHPGTRHIPSFDGLRGLAILLVLFLHFTILEPQTALEAGLVHLASLGTHGVDLFFVLSGFLVTRILLAAKGKAYFFRNFYARRALRIFPLYYTLIFLSFAVLPAFLKMFPGMQEKFSALDANPGEWAWYVFFASNFLTVLEQRFTHDILGVAWSLAIEEHFYLIWPWILAALDVNKLKRLLGVVILAALFLRTALWLDGWSPIQIYVLTFTRMDTIAFGALLALQLHERKAVFLPAEKARAGWGLALMLVLMAAAFGAGWFDVKSIYLNTFMYSAVGLLFYLLLKWAVTVQDSRVLQVLFTNRAMRAIGRYSYALYLLHIPVRVLVRNLWLGEAQFRDWPGTALLWQCVFYVTAFAVTYVLAWLSWNFLEKRFLNLKKHFES